MVEIIRRGNLNPLIKVSKDEVYDWLRGLADANGLSDRAVCAVQFTYDPLDGDPQTWNDLPDVVLMVSNIENSRGSNQ